VETVVGLHVYIHKLPFLATR